MKNAPSRGKKLFTGSAAGWTGYTCPYIGEAVFGRSGTNAVRADNRSFHLREHPLQRSPLGNVLSENRNGLRAAASAMFAVLFSVVRHA